MKTIKVLKLAIPTLMLISGSAFAQISGTAHDMTSGVQEQNFDNTGNTDAQICVYCHTPHNATGISGGPIWNRNLAAQGGFTMYVSGAGTSIDGTVSESPNPETMACLGCHDGVSAIDNISNLPGRDPDVTWATGGLSITGFAVVDGDLSDDHPVSITYSPGTGVGNDSGLNEQAAAETAGMVFFDIDNKVECATCHDVHGTANEAFLRVSAASSEICLVCHDK